MYICARNLVQSRTGRALIAIRDHPIAASAMGINVSLYKALTFGVSALYTGVAGALGAIAIAFVAPDSFTFVLAVALFVGLVVGGVGSIPGTLFGGCSSCSCRTSPSTSRRAWRGGLRDHPAAGHLSDADRLRGTGASRSARNWCNGALSAADMEEANAIESNACCWRPSQVLRPALRQPALAQKKYDAGANDTEIKIGNINPYSGPGLGLRPDRQDHRRLLQEGERRRRHQRPQDHLHHLRRRLFAAEGGRAGAQAGRERRGAAGVPAARHAVQHGDPEVHELQEGAAAVRRDRRDQVGRSARASRGPWAGSRPIRPKGGSTPPTSSRNHPNAKIGILYQNDDYGKDYVKGLEDGLGDKASMIIVRSSPTSPPIRPSTRRS